MMLVCVKEERKSAQGGGCNAMDSWGRYAEISGRCDMGALHRVSSDTFHLFNSYSKSNGHVGI